MKLVLGLLNQFLTDSLSVNQATSALERAGIEVEEVIHPPVFDDRIVVATVKALQPHPNADKLKVATVSCGDQELKIVCGAPNIATGQRVVLARVGAHLPGGQAIEAVRLRGVESQGMICSEKELGLGSNHDGILVLDDDIEECTPLSEVYSSSQTLIDTKTAANRWDLQSYRGVAREVAAHSGVGLSFDEPQLHVEDAQKSDALFINEAKVEVPGYSLMHLKTKSAGASSSFLTQNHLRLHGIKPVNAVVDITNLVMLETGQPLHAFDASKINGKVVVRFAQNEEKITTLDGVERILTSRDLVIADEKGPVALAGVMGGKDSEITPETKDILLEVATFDGAHVRKTARRNGLRTDASSRFERTIPLGATDVALARFYQLLQDTDELELVAAQIERNAWPWVQHIGIQKESMSRFLGMDLEEEDIISHLLSLGFDAEKFDIVQQAQKHIGKPYKLGARFRVDGVDAFDCSYLTDYLYSLIGITVGHTAHQQYKNAEMIDVDDLRPGDLVFRGGPWIELDEKEREGVSHVALYIGNGKIIEAKDFTRNQKSGEWEQLDESQRVVAESPLSSITGDPQFMGAGRFVHDIESYIRVTCPWWRTDVKNEADISEEVIKLVGLDKLPATLPKWEPNNFIPDKYHSRLNELRYGMKSLGLYEITTYPFIAQDDIEIFKGEVAGYLKLKNPRSSEQAYLRQSLLPQMTNSVVNNSTIEKEFGFFELAKTFHDVASRLPREDRVIGVMWRGEDALERVKGAVDLIAHLAHVKIRVVGSGSHPALHPSRQSEVEIDGKKVGYYGELHPDVATDKKLDSKVAYAELMVDGLIQLWSEPSFSSIPKLQSAYRDITFTVPESTQWQNIEERLEEINQVNVGFLDEYNDKGVRSITIRLEILAVERNLTEKEIESCQLQVVKVLEREFSAEVGE